MGPETVKNGGMQELEAHIEFPLPGCLPVSFADLWELRCFDGKAQYAYNLDAYNFEIYLYAWKLYASS